MTKRIAALDSGNRLSQPALLYVATTPRCCACLAPRTGLDSAQRKPKASAKFQSRRFGCALPGPATTTTDRTPCLTLALYSCAHSNRLASISAIVRSQVDNSIPPRSAACWRRILSSTKSSIRTFLDRLGSIAAFIVFPRVPARSRAELWARTNFWLYRLVLISTTHANATQFRRFRGHPWCLPGPKHRGSGLRLRPRLGSRRLGSRHHALLLHPLLQVSAADPVIGAQAKRGKPT